MQQVVHARQLTEQTIHALELQLETERMKRRTLLNVEATLKSAAEPAPPADQTPSLALAGDVATYID